MKNGIIAQLPLQLRLSLSRLGVIKPVAILLVLAGALAWAWGLPHMRQREMQLHKTLDATRIALAQPISTATTPSQISLPEQRLQQFHDVLGESRYAEQQVKTLFALATRNGLTLNQAEYKYAYDKGGKFHSYAISLPVKGAYAAIRPFCEQVLLAIPFASLDAVDFKRDAVGNTTIDAKLHFTLYLDNGADTSATGDNPSNAHAGADL